MFSEFVINEKMPGSEVVVYQAPLPLRPSKKALPLRLIGFAFLFVSLLGFLAILSPIILAEINFRLRHANTTKSNQENRISFFGYLLWLDEQNLTAPVDWQFGLIIPKIGVNSRVYPQVNPNNKEEYLPYLKTGVAHAQGTALPDSLGTVYIFGHSSNLLWDANRDNAVFYLLKNLEKGDRLIVFYQGQKYEYQVSKKEILGANEVPTYVSQTTEKLLVLQTCWPPGTDWKRLFVLAEPISEKGI